MKRGIVTLKELLGNIPVRPSPVERAPSVPAVVATPAPQKQKVVSIPTRTPVNRQAAYVTAPNNSWLSQPPVELTKAPTHQELRELQAQLRIERVERGELADKLNLLRVANAALKREYAKLKTCFEQVERELNASKQEVVGLEKKLNQAQALLRDL